MKLVMLTDRIAVNPDAVESVLVTHEGNEVIVTVISGMHFSIAPRAGMTVMQTANHIADILSGKAAR